MIHIRSLSTVAALVLSAAGVPTSLGAAVLEYHGDISAATAAPWVAPVDYGQIDGTSVDLVVTIPDAALAGSITDAFTGRSFDGASASAQFFNVITAGSKGYAAAGAAGSFGFEGGNIPGGNPSVPDRFWLGLLTTGLLPHGFFVLEATYPSGTFVPDVATDFAALAGTVPTSLQLRLTNSRSADDASILFYDAGATLSVVVPEPALATSCVLLVSTLAMRRYRRD